MNCVFVCVFNQNEYVDMLFMLLESIFIYGQLDDRTEILVYTSTQFMNRIKQSHLFNDRIKFELNDTYNSIDSACKARLDLFSLASIGNYNKVLYLDTDIIINGDINQIFDACTLDVLYALEEGTIDYHLNYWGKSLFGSEINNYSDKTAFSSGILLFNNCESIKNLFSKINEDIINRPNHFDCCDQPYVVYNAFKYNLYNNKVMKSFAINNCLDPSVNKVIYHFPGGPGVYKNKLVNMINFTNSLKLRSVQPKIFENRNEMLAHYCEKLSNPNLLEIGVFKGDFLEYLVNLNKSGSIDAVDLFEGETCSGDANGNNVVHYNVGLSYLELIKKYKYNSNVRIYKSNSISFLENQDDSTYDVIYIDGDHSYNGVKNDLINSYRAIKNGGYIMGHDYEMNMEKATYYYDFGVKRAVDEFCVNYRQTILAKAMDGCVSYCIKICK
jgi:hypothetical protein